MKKRRNKLKAMMFVAVITCCMLTGCSQTGKKQVDVGTDSLVVTAEEEDMDVTEEAEVSVPEEMITEDVENNIQESLVTEDSEVEGEQSEENSTEEAETVEIEKTEPKPVPEPEPSKPAEHVHTLMEEVADATCDTAKQVTTRCSSCDYVEGTVSKGKALGHDYVESWLYEPTCSGMGYKVVKCSRCDKEGEGSGDVPALGHTYKTTIKVEGDCKTPQLRLKTCTVCGYEETETDKEIHANDHVWVDGYYEEWSDEEFAMVQIPRTCCSVCGMDKPE